MDELRLLQAVGHLGERFVVEVGDAADGWFDACLGEALGDGLGYNYDQGETRRGFCPPGQAKKPGRGSAFNCWRCLL